MEIVRFNPLVDTPALAKVYAEVFAGPPWNENTKCPGCDEYFGLATTAGQVCINSCGNLLEEAYPSTPTSEYILDETSRPESLAELVKTDGQIVAFTWGFKFPNPREFAEEKYRTPAMQDKVVAALTGNGITDAFFYVSECGVKPKYRSQGLSNQLFQNLEDRRRSLGLPAMLRTNIDSPMVAVSDRFGMRQVLGPQVVVDRVNRKLITTGQLVNGVLDTENQARTLFVLGRPRT